MIEDTTDSHSQRRVMLKRYVDGKKFEAIAYEMNVDVRYIFRLHKQVIDKIVNS
jgi:DNA-directed RNA polymerase specialized sigma subunit